MKIENILLLTLLFFVLSTKTGYAYLDPGTGSFILQMLAASVLGGLFAVKTFWRQITSFFNNLFSRNKQTETAKSVKKKPNAK